MGFDKATIVVDGRSLAVRAADVLAEVCDLVVEVGPGVSGAPIVVREDPEGEGPLAAVAAGAAALDDRGHHGDALVMACDLPRLGVPLLALLARWPGGGSVVPVVDGRPQPLCARWSATDLGTAVAAVASGERSLRPLLARPGVRFLDQGGWGRVAGAHELADADVPEDLDRLVGVWRPAVHDEAARPDG